MQNFADKTLINVPIFTSGTHKDSLGVEKDFTNDDLRAMINAFGQGAPPSVPIKIGHSSDEFNSKVATAFNIPKELVAGEGPSGKGQVRLGEITGLKLDGDNLLADLRVAEPVAGLIKEELLTGLSSELQFDRKQGDVTHPMVVSGLALLGAQRAALSNLPSLQAATMLDDGTYADAVYFSESTFASRDEKGRFISEGSKQLSNADVTAPEGGDHKVFTVPVNDLTRGRQVFASVSAPDEITAKRTALRVVENFLFSLGGPLGTALGVTGGAILSARLIAGKPILGGIKGLIRWKFEEEFNLGEETLELDSILRRIGILTSNLQLQEGLKIMSTQKFVAPEGVSQEAYDSCLAQARTDGVDDPAAHCKEKLTPSASDNSELLSGIAKALNLSEWDNDTILVKMKELATASNGSASFEEKATKEIAELRQQNRVFHYQETTIGFTEIPGTAKENAEKLAEIEASAGEVTAKMMLESWEAQNDSAKKAKISTSVLESGEHVSAEFSESVKKYQEANPDSSRADALKEVMRKNPTQAASRNGTS